MFTATHRYPTPLLWLLATIAGGLQAVALAWPWGVADATWNGIAVDTASLWWPSPGQPWPLGQVAALATLAHLLQRSRTARQAGGLGWAFATAWLAGTFWWLFVSMHTHGGLAAPLAVLAVLGLAGALAIYHALACMLFKRLSLVFNGLIALFFNSLSFAACWALAELARATLFTGFPWGAVGYAHVNSLAWLAPWVGVQGMGVLVAAMSAWLAGLVSIAWSGGHLGRASRGRLPLAKVGLLLLGVPSFLALAPWLQPRVANLTQANGEFPVVLLQGNIAQDDKFDTDTGVPQALTWYSQRLGGDPPAPAGGLVIAPETALPLLPQQLDKPFWSPLLGRLSEQNHAVLFGIPLGDYTHGYSNAVWAITPRQAWLAQSRLGQDTSPGRLDEPDPDTQGAPIYRYTKHHLVPFGEFIPPAFRWFVDMMSIPLGDFNRGPLGQPAFEWNGQRIAPNICYEDLFGEELARGFLHAGSAPTVMVNVSNLAWFGNTVALDQHLHISRLRALELGRPMVRATNTGATVVIDHLGTVTHALPRLQAGRLLAEVQGRNGLTPYARWASRWGLWPVLWAVLAMLALAALIRLRLGSAGQPLAGP